MRLDVHRAWARVAMTASARLRLYRKLAAMQANGLPLLRILEDLYMRASVQGRKPQEPMAIVLAECRRAVQNGQPLAEGLRDWVPMSEHLIILAAEQSGRLESGLMAVTDVVQASRRIRAVILGGAAYPLLVLAVVLGYMVLFGALVIPEFAKVSNPEHWRGQARLMHLMSLWVQRWMPTVVVALLLLGVAVARSLPRWRGHARLLADRLPPYSIYRLVSGSGFLLAFSALLAAGVTVEKALLRLCDSASPWLLERLEGALLGVKSGLNFGEALKNAGYGFPSPEIVDDLCIHAEYRGLPETLKSMADEWLEEGVVHIAKQMKLLNGVVIAVLALLIAGLVGGLFSILQQVGASTRLLH